jgi:N-acetylmuramoyl-L-alanine amidase
MTKIAIDDGHGRETAGKRTPAFSDGSVMRENEFNEAVALYLEKALKRCGFDVLMVAPETTDTPLKTRVQRANNAKADVYISIHANAIGDRWSTANGVESWIYEGVKNGSQTYKLAEFVHNYLINATGRRDRGIKRSKDLYVLNSTKMHAVLVECGFMTNLEEAKLLQDDGYRRKCAEGICMGICTFYGKEYKEEKKMAEMTVQEAINVVQEKAGLEEKTVEFLLAYKYGEVLVKKLAAAMVK